MTPNECDSRAMELSQDCRNSGPGTARVRQCDSPVFTIGTAHCSAARKRTGKKPAAVAKPNWSTIVATGDGWG
jgi:hypothetical protein